MIYCQQFCLNSKFYFKMIKKIKTKSYIFIHVGPFPSSQNSFAWTLFPSHIICILPQGFPLTVFPSARLLVINSFSSCMSQKKKPHYFVFSFCKIFFFFLVQNSRSTAHFVLFYPFGILKMPLPVFLLALLCLGNLLSCLFICFNVTRPPSSHSHPPSPGCSEDVLFITGFDQPDYGVF